MQKFQNYKRKINKIKEVVIVEEFEYDLQAAEALVLLLKSVAMIFGTFFSRMRKKSRI
jgi:hypothetical protein